MLLENKKKKRDWKWETICFSHYSIFLCILYWFSIRIQLYRSMLFQAQWLISIWNTQTNIGFLIEGSSETAVRAVCNKHSIAVFGLIPFVGDPKTYGTVFFRFIEGKEEMTIYTQYEKAREAFTFFRSAGFLINYINNSKSPISDADVVRVIEKLEAEYKESLIKDPDKGNNYFEKISKIFVERSGQWLISLKQLATVALSDADEILPRVASVQPTAAINIKNLQDELKKVKLGTNEARIRDAIGMLYHSLEEAELVFLQSQKEHEVSVIQGSIVTYLDVLTEAEKFEKSQKVSQAWAHKSGSDLYYGFLWALGLYNKFLTKDFKNKTKSVVIILDTLYSVFGMFVLMTMVRLALLQLVNTLYFKGSFFTPRFIDLWLIGLCSAILMYYKKPDLKNLLLLWPLCVGLFFLARFLINTTFWF